MDGPTIPHTTADLFLGNKYAFLTYHVSSAGFHALGTVGSLLGGAMYGAGLFRGGSAINLLSMMGTAGLVGNAAGTALGLTRLAVTAQKGVTATPIPFNEEGVQQRVDGLQHNFKVRVLDASASTGMILAAVALVLAGGPVKLNLSNGLWGVGQAISLGSTIGVLGAVGYVWSINRVSSDDKDDD